MKKLIHIQITGLGIIQRYTGEDAENDYLEAIKEAADKLQQEDLQTATVCLFENENDEHDKAIKKFELMRF